MVKPEDFRLWRQWALALGVMGLASSTTTHAFQGPLAEAHGGPRMKSDHRQQDQASKPREQNTGQSLSGRMTPEERRQLRQDVGQAGRALYPGRRGHRRGGDQ